MRVSRHAEHQFVHEYMIDLDPEAAAVRTGIRASPKFYGNALLRRPTVKAALAQEMEARRIRIQIDADFVLAELMRQYVRLKGMLGHDCVDLYRDGALRPILEWPEIWRTRLVTEIESKEFYEYSHDGTQAGESKTWDAVGRINKIKRESALSIEKEIRSCLRQIGEHIDVKAFQVPGKTDINIVVITAEQARKVAGAKKRLARAEKVLDVKAKECDE